MSTLSTENCMYYAIIGIGAVVIIFLLGFMLCKSKSLSKNKENFRKESPVSLKGANDSSNNASTAGAPDDTKDSNRTEEEFALRKGQLEKSECLGLSMDKDSWQRKECSSKFSDIRYDESRRRFYKKDVTSLQNKILAGKQTDKPLSFGDIVSQLPADEGTALNQATESRQGMKSFVRGPTFAFNKMNEERERQQLNIQRSVAKVKSLNSVNHSAVIGVAKQHNPDYLLEMDERKPHTDIGMEYTSFSYNEIAPDDFQGAMFDVVSDTRQTQNGMLTRYGELLNSVKVVEKSSNQLSALKNIIYPQFIQNSPMISSRHVSRFIRELLKSSKVDKNTVYDFYVFLGEKRNLNVHQAVTLLKYFVKYDFLKQNAVQDLMNRYSKNAVDVIAYAMSSPKFLQKLMSKQQAVSYANANFTKKQKEAVMMKFVNNKTYAQIMSALREFRANRMLSGNLDSVRDFISKLHIFDETKTRLLVELKRRRENFFLPSNLGDCTVGSAGFNLQGSCNEGMLGYN